MMRRIQAIKEQDILVVEGTEVADVTIRVVDEADAVRMVAEAQDAVVVVAEAVIEERGDQKHKIIVHYILMECTLGVIAHKIREVQITECLDKGAAMEVAVVVEAKVTIMYNAMEMRITQIQMQQIKMQEQQQCECTAGRQSK
jgi:hypothetical protein